MTTVLDKELRRSVTVGGAVYTVSIDPEGFRLTGKGKRKAEVSLRWRDLLSGDTALATALNASLMLQPVRPATAQVLVSTAKAPRKKNPQRRRSGPQR